MATLKEIANKANVSISSVSRVLNYDDTLSISEQKRKLIFKIAEDLKYESPRKRRNESAGKSIDDFTNYRIGIIHFLSVEEELDDPYYISIRIGIEKKCNELGIECVKIYKNGQNYASEQIKNVNGVIAIGKFSKDEIRMIQTHCKDIVVVDSSPVEEEIDSVVVEIDKTIKNILDFAILNGFKKIGFFGGVENYTEYKTYLGEKRMTTYVEYMKDKGLYNEDYLIMDSFGTKNGYNMFKKAYLKNKLPELIIAGNDSVALGVLKAIHEVGLNIPEDISIIGINDIPTAQYTYPPLTTVKLYSEFMGETAVYLLIERKGNRLIPKKVVIPSKLIIRATCKINNFTD